LALIFVTGGRGAIGREVVAAARVRGHSVAGVGYGAWLGDNELPKIDHWLDGGVDSDNLSRLTDSAGNPDVIVHLAGGSLVGASISNPSEDFRRTVTGTQKLLEWQRREAPQTRLVMVSSAAVYGDGHSGSIPETTPPMPTSPYGTHKAMAEALARSYADRFGIRVAIVRLFSVYGPGLRKQLIWDLASRLASGERRFSLAGSGKERRDFVYVADAAEILLDAIDLAEASAPTFNGCGGAGTEIGRLVSLIGDHFAGAKFDFSGEPRPGDPYSLVGDPSLSGRAGLSVKTDLETGIGATVEWIKGLPRAELR